MDLDGIDRRVKLIMEQVVNKIDYHFKVYQMVNIERHAYTDSVIDDEDWYEYWKEVSYDIKVLLGDILEIIETEDYKENFRAKELLNETFDYKLLCDKYIASNKHYTREDIEADAFGEENKESKVELFSPLEVINEKQKDKIIKIIHSYLVDNDLIKDSEIENFRKLFVNDSNPNMIRWNGDAIMFVAFIDLLIDKKIISLPYNYKDRYWEYFTRIFIDKSGNRFSTKLLGNRRSQINYDKKKKIIKEGLFSSLEPYLS